MTSFAGTNRGAEDIRRVEGRTQYRGVLMEASGRGRIVVGFVNRFRRDWGFPFILVAGTSFRISDRLHFELLYAGG